MKILLIQPPTGKLTIGGDEFFINEPLSLEYLASGIKEQHEVKILDMRFDKNLDEILEKFNPDVAGITSYTVNVNTVKTLFEKIKLLNQKIFTVVGGHHATVVPEDFATPFIDLIVLGEGVFVFKEIISRLENKMNFDGIRGIAYKDKSEFVKIQPDSITDLDVFPFPARELTEKYRKNYYTDWMKPLASIRTSKGCPFRCSFCALWKIANRKYIKREPENIVKELLEIKENFIFFADDESLVDVERMKRLAMLIKEAGIKKRYFLYGRSDTIAGNPELIGIWKEIGLERIFVGLESFKDEDLRYINKSSTIEHNKKAIEILQSFGIEIYASFIVRPDFSIEDFRALKKYCRNFSLTFPTFSVLTPLPGTDFYDEVKEQLITENSDLFDFIHSLLPTKLPMKEFYKNLISLYVKAKPPIKGTLFLMKFPFKDIPILFRKFKIFSDRVKNAYMDY